MKPLIYLGLIFFTLSSCSKKQESFPETHVSTSVAKQEEMTISETFLGSVEGVNEVRIYSSVPGKLVSYEVAKGESVEKDQILAKIDRDEVGFQYELSSIKSPIQGIVGDTFLDKGDKVLKETPIALVVSLDQEAVFFVGEEFLPKIQKGMECLIELQSGGQAVGKVTELPSVVDITTRTGKVHSSISKDLQSYPGMSVKVAVILERQKGIMIPEEALFFEGGKPFVYVIKENQSSLRSVEVGKHLEGKVMISSGLSDGEIVVRSGHQKLKDKQAVHVSL